MAETTVPSANIDDTPLSPIERQQSLEKHLQMRPDVQDLKDKNILKDTNAAPYISSSKCCFVRSKVLTGIASGASKLSSKSLSETRSMIA